MIGDRNHMTNGKVLGDANWGSGELSVNFVCAQTLLLRFAETKEAKENAW